MRCYASRGASREATVRPVPCSTHQETLAACARGVSSYLATPLEALPTPHVTRKLEVIQFASQAEASTSSSRHVLAPGLRARARAALARLVPLGSPTSHPGRPAVVWPQGEHHAPAAPVTMPPEVTSLRVPLSWALDDAAEPPPRGPEAQADWLPSSAAGMDPYLLRRAVTWALFTSTATWPTWCTCPQAAQAPG